MADRALARKVLQTEAAAILALVERVDERFDRAIELLRQCRGRVILTGMGSRALPENLGSPFEHRHALVLPASGRSDAR